MISSSPLLSRRSLLAWAGSICLSGCTPHSTWGMLKDTLALSSFKRGDYPRTREEVDALPYAQLGLRIGGSSPAILVLSEQVGADLHWVSANRTLIVTRRGRIVRTVGLAVDLHDCRPQTADLLETYDYEHAKLNQSETRFSADFGTQYSIPVSSRFNVANDETINILGESVDTLRVEEKIRCDALRWASNNRYWLSKRSALIWRSRQTIVPGGPVIEYEILKRPET